MRRRALLFGLLLAACGKSRKEAPAIAWFDLDFALRQAARNHRPLFVYFGATWDCASKELEHATFPEPNVATLLCESFVCARVDCSDDEDAKTMEQVRRFDVKGTPTLLVMHPARDVELWRATEYVKPESLAFALRAARARHDAMRDVESALRLSTAWQRPVLLAFLPAYDHGSERIRRDCLGDANVAAMVRDSFVLVDVFCDEGSNEDWQRFGVRGSPTVIVWDAARSEELARMEEIVGPRVFERFLHLGLARHRA
jgi:hypothetical protein